MKNLPFQNLPDPWFYYFYNRFLMILCIFMYLWNVLKNMKYWFYNMFLMIYYENITSRSRGKPSTCSPRMLLGPRKRETLNGNPSLTLSGKTWKYWFYNVFLMIYSEKATEAIPAALSLLLLLQYVFNDFIHFRYKWWFNEKHENNNFTMCF